VSRAMPQAARAIWFDAIFANSFWQKVSVAGPDECWPWLASCVKGRGRISLGGKMHLAPRISLVLRDRAWPADGLVACHSCDNALCVNPKHLWWGTVADNNRDTSIKGRGRGPAKHGQCRKGHVLTDENRSLSRGCKTCRRERFAIWQRAQRAASRFSRSGIAIARGAR
jgi:hypothetical protein